MKDWKDGLNPAEQEEVRASIANLMNDPAYTLAFARLKEQYTTELISEQVGSLTSHTLHASLKVLEQVGTELALMASSIRHQKMTRGQ